MKPDSSKTETPENTLTGPRYWRSLDELAENPEFREWAKYEFPAGADELNGVNRRHFMKIMAASFAMAGVGLASGCRRPEKNIRPYSVQPERIIPGLPVFYATSYPGSLDNLPLIVESHQNRPTKVEGNPYASYQGATDLQTQASVLELYDPDRSTQSSKGTKTLTPDQVKDLLATTQKTYAAIKGKGLAILATPSTSPTRAKLHKALLETMPEAVWAEYEPVAQDRVQKAATTLFEQPVRPLYALDKARCVLSLDADFLGSEPGKIGNARAFARSRKVKGVEDAHQMSRLYVAESSFSQTGTMADHRLRLSVSHMNAFAARLTAQVLRQLGKDAGYASVLENASTGLTVDAKWIAECARDLIAHKGKAVVLTGSHLPESVQLLGLYLNDLLGAYGNTVELVSLPEAPSSTDIRTLAAAMTKGDVKTLVILGGNPSYDAPADIQWNTALKSVPQVIRYGLYFDETSIEAMPNGGTHIAATHYLETWSDGRMLDGTLVPVQPLILPLFDGIQEIELLARLIGTTTTDPYALVFETFSEQTTELDKQKAFARFLNDGFLKDSPFAPVTPALSVPRLITLLNGVDWKAPALSATALELRIIPDAKVLDGRHANNGWLQECPDPMSKLAWDNVISVSPKLAHALGFDPKTQQFLHVSAMKANQFNRGAEEAPVFKLTINGVTVQGPLQIQPGLPDYTVITTLGYGRRKTGRVGTDTGFDVYPLTRNDQSWQLGAQLENTGNYQRLANMQMHWSMEGRDIVREGNVDMFAENPAFAQGMGMESHSPAIYGKDKDKSLQYKVTHQPRGNSLYETPTFTDPQQWGMSIDLNACYGCNACVVACQSENNIPIVGREQVIRGREMHWIRLDRYYSTGDVEQNKYALPEDPQVSLMPMGCQHCEMAPCEQVCPVNATVHDEQGLNVMAYNRCVGTRYCANNCPYKVRRFNFFDYNKRAIGEFYMGPLGPNKYKKTPLSELPNMQKNPDVTVRMRGVMEKCNYCQQRIEQTRIAQRVKAKDSGEIMIPDGVLKTACQQVCPAEAIVFGDVADANSAVSKAKDSPRDYSVLGYLNTRPRTSYLARLRNPNKAMPDYREQPLSFQEYIQKNEKGHTQQNSHEAADAVKIH
jgi:molybdopterin-containing oxidoreductase family iron-sulfur binding subunit